MKNRSILLLLFCTIFSPVFALSFSPSVSPGVYNHDVVLTLTADTSNSIYYSFESSQDLEKVKYGGPLVLSAISGEKKSYVIALSVENKNGGVIIKKKLTYTIDKTVPIPPSVNLSEGVYNTNLDFTFRDTGNTIHYSISENGSGPYKIWNGSSIQIQQSAKTRNIILRAYTVSSSGNRSSEILKRFTILPLEPIADSIHVYSPVNGTFLNSQLLYIDLKGFKWVRYSIGNNDPAKFGTSYRYPILFKEKGSYILHIAGLPYRSTKIIQKTVRFRIQDGKRSICSVESGLYTDPFIVKLNGSGYRYRLSDAETEKSTYTPYTRPFSLFPVEGTVKLVPLRVTTSQNESDGVYRYFYVFDKRKPGTPLIHGQLIRQNKSADISIDGPAQTRIYYTLDGSTPDKYSFLYKRPFEINFPDEIKAGSKIIKAAAFYPNNKGSAPAVYLLNYDFLPPSKPEFSLKKIDQNTYHLSVINKNDNTFFYTLSYNGTIPPVPNMKSFVGEKNSYFHFPFGITGRLTISGILMDDAGNFSPVSTISADFDTQPPPSVNIRIDSGSIILTGGNTIYYGVTQNTGKNTSLFKKYKDPLQLKDFKEGTNFYTYTVDKNGNKSATVVWKIPLLRNQSNNDFFYTGINNNGVYNTARTLRLYPNPGVSLYYRISENGIPPADPLPVPEMRIINPLIFKTDKNTEKTFLIKILSTHSDTSQKNTITQLSFTIDKVPPPVPVFTTIVNDAVYNSPVIFSVKNHTAPTWILWQKNFSPDERESLAVYLKKGVRLKDTITLDVNKGEDKSFQISAAALDKAGNVSFSAQPVTIRIDKNPPAPPSLFGITPGEKTDKPVTFSLYSESADKLFYSISQNGKIPDIFYGKQYTKPVTVSGKENSLVTYTVKAWSVDEAGNYSSKVVIAPFTISRINVSPIQPVIQQMSEDTAVVSFPDIHGVKIYYRWLKNSYLLYNSPILVSLNKTGDQNAFFTYTVDCYGNKSPITVRFLQYNNKKAGLLSGAKKNGIYKTAVTIKKRYPDSLIRYEVTTQKTPAPEVTYFSPELTGNLTFNAAKGETLHITINVKAFDRRTFEPVSSEESYAFTIDRSIPVKPQISGVHNGDYYQNGRVVSFSSDDGTVYYTLQKNGSIPGLYRPYVSPLHIDVKEGTFSDFSLKAYTQDKAGNRSPLTAVSFSIDKSNVYLSTRGKDSYDGTRSRPLRTLEAALKRAEKTGRKKIYLTEGEYTLEEGTVLNTDISLLGGFSFPEWKKSNGKTVFIRKGNNRHSPLFTILSGNVYIKNASIHNIGLDAPLIDQQGGVLHLSNSNIIFANGRGIQALKTIAGSLYLDNVNFYVGPVKNTLLIGLKNCSFRINRTTIRSTGTFDTLKVFNISHVASGSFNKVTIDPSGGHIIELFRVTNSTLTCTDCSVQTGTDLISAAGFMLDGTDLTLKNVSFNGDPGSRILSFMDSNNSTVHITDSTVTGSALSGISLFNMDKSELYLNKVTLKAGDTPDFMYTVKSNASKLQILHSKFTLGNSSDSFFLNAVNSSLDFEQSELLSINTKNTAIFDLNDMKTVNLEGNSIKQQFRTAAVPVCITGKGRVFIRDNIFTNWPTLVNDNGILLKTGEDLNTYAGFSAPPAGNSSE